MNYIFRTIGFISQVIRHNALVVIRYSGLGDVLWVEPILNTLLEENAGRQIHFVSRSPDLFLNYPNPNVHFHHASKDKGIRIACKILIAIRWKKHYLDLNNSYERFPEISLLHGYQKSIGIPQNDQYPNIYLSEIEKNKFKNATPYVVIHIETLTDEKMREVHGIEWQKIIELLIQKGFDVFFVGVQKPNFEDIKYHKGSIRDVIALIYHATLFIGIDSGPSHIAAALSIPSILFFGGVNPFLRHFLSLRPIHIMQNDCIYAGCYHTFTSSDNRACRINPTDGNPPCCTFTTEMLTTQITRSINNMQKKY